MSFSKLSGIPLEVVLKVVFVSPQELKVLDTCKETSTCPLLTYVH